MTSPGFAAASANIPNFSTNLLPIFHIEKVQHQFLIASPFVFHVAPNINVIALASRRLPRIDLASPQDVNGTRKSPIQCSQLTVIPGIRNRHPPANPQKPVPPAECPPTDSEVPRWSTTATHNKKFSLHSRSTNPRYLPPLVSLHIECATWSPALPSVSTREILIGTQDEYI